MFHMFIFIVLIRHVFDTKELHIFFRRTNINGKYTSLFSTISNIYMGSFVKIVNSFQSVTIFCKKFAIDVWQVVHCTSWKCSSSWKFSLLIVYIFKRPWHFFLTKFWFSNQMFIWNIFTPICLKFDTFAHANPRLLFYTYLQISWHDICWKLTLRILFEKWRHKMTSRMWSRNFSQNFLQCVQILSRNVNI